MRNIARNPDDTSQVFRLIDALSGSVRERIMRRFVKTDTGQQILRERRILREFLADRDALAAMPEGSLARAYLDFISTEHLSPEGMKMVSEQGRLNTGLTPDEELVADRLRDQHDIWHAVTGYGRDIIGESALMAFTFAQVWNPGPGIIALAAWFRHGRKVPNGRRMIWKAYRRGRTCAWLAAQDWEALFPRPLDEVRRELHLKKCSDYQPLWSDAAKRIMAEAERPKLQTAAATLGKSR